MKAPNLTLGALQVMVGAPAEGLRPLPPCQHISDHPASPNFWMNISEQGNYVSETKIELSAGTPIPDSIITPVFLPDEGPSNEGLRTSRIIELGGRRAILMGPGAWSMVRCKECSNLVMELSGEAPSKKKNSKNAKKNRRKRKAKAKGGESQQNELSPNSTSETSPPSASPTSAGSKTKLSTSSHEDKKESPESVADKRDNMMRIFGMSLRYGMNTKGVDVGGDEDYGEFGPDLSLKTARLIKKGEVLAWFPGGTSVPCSKHRH